jgi:hypothetical protein
VKDARQIGQGARSMIPSSYQHAADSGVYLPGIDTSRVDNRRPIAGEEMSEPAVLLIMGQSNGGNHGGDPIRSS